MADKRSSLPEAAALVQDNQTLGIGGMTIYRRPVAFVRQLIAQPQPPQNLTLLAFTAGLAADMLIGAGLVTTTRTCYFGLEIFGLAPMFTAAAGHGRLHIIEETEASIASGLRARMARVGFMPSRAWQGTDLFAARPDVHTITDPYTGAALTAFPAISCDVAIVHALKADKMGNAVLGGNPTIDAELCLVADTAVITAEEVVDRLEAPVDIAGELVTAVVHVPNGAWPTSCYPRYPIDGETILDYVAACNNGRFAQFVGVMTPQGQPR